ncbi:hypothetical protein WA026_002240 [Henosepilachna vigintioctopunctata]|uniref:Uncharacterized protein n=1 Tax=Henosepilachna vigintioctopunctata TaxID=420089 RepID=A0AAW1U0L0_9CUCU
MLFFSILVAVSALHLTHGAGDLQPNEFDSIQPHLKKIVGDEWGKESIFKLVYKYLTDVTARSNGRSNIKTPHIWRTNERLASRGRAPTDYMYSRQVHPELSRTLAELTSKIK